MREQKWPISREKETKKGQASGTTVEKKAEHQGQFFQKKLSFRDKFKKKRLMFESESPDLGPKLPPDLAISGSDLDMCFLGSWPL